MDWRVRLSQIGDRFRRGEHDPTLQALSGHWEKLAEEDPLWAILAHPAKRGGRWALDEFLATGEKEIEEISAYVARLSVQPHRKAALDFGCGVGRLTRALSRRFRLTYGVDLSPAMLEQARRINADVPRCRFRLQQTDRLPFRWRRFDFVYSALVLQHMDGELALGYVGEFVRILKKGGLAVFQAPSRHLEDDAEKVVTTVQLKTGVAEVEMNAHPRERVEETIRSAGGRIVDVKPDDSAGEAFESFYYAVTR